MRKLLILVALVVVAFLALPFIVGIGSALMNPRESSPAEAGLKAANTAISANSGTTAFGNSEQARALAADYSLLLKAIADGAFTGGKASSLSTSKGEMLVHCQLVDAGCVFLVHVPELRQYKGEVRDQLTALAWQAAQKLVSARLPAAPRRLAVGLRGAMLYGPVAIGGTSGRPDSSDDANRALPRDLLAFFEPAAPAGAAATPPTPTAAPAK